MGFLLLSTTFGSMSLGVLAQVVPFSTTGFLDKYASKLRIYQIMSEHVLSAVSFGDSVRSDGTFSVNGFSIRIPDNLLVEFPALQVPFKEFAAGNRGLGPYEVSVRYIIMIRGLIAP